MAKAVQKTMDINAYDFQMLDLVQVIDREATPEENKSRIFYNHMRGLTGTIRRVYPENQEIWVDVDLDSLPEDVRQRHQETEDQMRSKWLDGLSDDARRKLGEMEKKFSLRYSILVSPNHLILKERPKGVPSSSDPVPAVGGVEASSASARKSTKDLNDAEQEFLERAKQKKVPE